MVVLKKYTIIYQSERGKRKCGLISEFFHQDIKMVNVKSLAYAGLFIYVEAYL